MEITIAQETTSWTPYLIRSYAHFQIRYNSLYAAFVERSNLVENMEIWQVARAATADPLCFKDFKLQRHHPQKPVLFRATRDRDCTEVVIKEIESAFGKDNLGVIVSVGAIRYHPVQRKERGTSVRLSDSHTIEGGENRYWRFDDTTDFVLREDEWKPSGSSKHIGKATMTTIDLAFTTWKYRAENIDNLAKCAAQLVARRRARTRDRFRWKIYATGVNDALPQWRISGEL